MRVAHKCRACGHEVREYKRTLRKSQVKWLAWLVQESRKQVKQGLLPWVPKAGKRTDAPPQGDDYSRLALWGLIEKYQAEDSKDPSYGAWRPTPLGVGFILGEQRVPEYVLEQEGRVVFASGLEVFASEVIGERFDLERLISGAA